MESDQNHMPPSIHIEHRFEAPVERVYHAFTQASELGAWVWGSMGHDVECDVDLRVGGRYSVYTNMDKDYGWHSKRFGMLGVYVEIRPLERLVYTLHWDAPVGYNQTGEVVADEIVIVDFEEDGEGCRICFRQLGVDGSEAAAEHERSIRATFGDLESHLATHS